MDFLENLMRMMPENDRATLQERLGAMTDDERAEANEAAERYYRTLAEGRQMRIIQSAIRYNYADRKVEGAAASRRRKQMERNKANKEL